jgi:hypothetical protein
MAADFRLHEDDWGMVDVVPVEAQAEAARAVESGRGAIDDAPASPLSVRGLTLPALTLLVGPGWRTVREVRTGYDGRFDERVPDGFALLNKDGDALYGVLDDAGRVAALHVHDRGGDAEGLAAALGKIGAALRVVLVDLWQDVVVDLTDAEAVLEWASADEDDDDGPRGDA